MLRCKGGCHRIENRDRVQAVVPDGLLYAMHSKHSKDSKSGSTSFLRACKDSGEVHYVLVAVGGDVSPRILHSRAILIQHPQADGEELHDFPRETPIAQTIDFEGVSKIPRTHGPS